MTPPPAPDPCARTIGWPRSPVVVFGIAASFFVIMGTIFSSPAVFNSRLPVVLQGQITRVPAGYLVLLVAAPFAIFALMYWVAGFEGAREYEKNPTRICRFWRRFVSICPGPRPLRIVFPNR